VLAAGSTAADGYKDIGVIGPLFLVQAIACIVFAVAIMPSYGRCCWRPAPCCVV
jgi:hypothetical protein